MSRKGARKGKDWLRIASAIVLASFIVLTLLLTTPVEAGDEDTPSSELLLRFKPGTSERSKKKVLTSLGLEVRDEVPEIQLLVVRIPRNDLQNVKSALSRNLMIDFVEQNCWVSPSAVPNDEYYLLQWHLEKIGAPEAWDVSLGDPNVIIAVLDSGVDPEHPDLAAKLLPGYNFYDSNYDTGDVYGHGTKVAGVAAALTNNVVGVASMGWRVSILPVRVTDVNGYTSYSLLAKGLVYAADRGAKAATMSFRIFGGHALSSAAKYFMDKGGLVVAAGGNTGSYQSDLDNPYIISVSATTSSDSLATFSTYGQYIDLSAPGVGIYTTIRGGGYGRVSGTSFSTPLTAGLVALVFSANPSLAPDQVEHILESTAVDLGEPSYDIYYGWGRIDTSKALKAAVGAAPPRDTTPPTVVITSPLNGATVSGGITVSVDASDDVAITKVELHKDGGLFAVDFDPPWEFYWDTTSDFDGPHTLAAKAYDTSNNVGESNLVTVNVYNAVADRTPPAVSVNYPSDGVKVSGFVDISVSASDKSGVSKVEFYIDDKLRGTVYSPPYTYRWNTKFVKDGWHAIRVRAYDGVGNSAEASVRVIVSNRK